MCIHTQAFYTLHLRAQHCLELWVVAMVALLQRLHHVGMLRLIANYSKLGDKTSCHENKYLCIVTSWIRNRKVRIIQYVSNIIILFAVIATEICYTINAYRLL